MYIMYPLFETTANYILQGVGFEEKYFRVFNGYIPKSSVAFPALHAMGFGFRRCVLSRAH